MALLSVVIPCLSIDDYTRAAIASLGVGGSATELEVVVVVDGEEEGSAGKELTVDGVTARVAFTGRRSGSGHATNVGAALSNGELIGRMDADDISLPGRIDAEVDALESDQDAVAVGGGGELVSPSGEVVGRYPTLPGGDIRPLLLRRNPIIHSSLIMRREAFERVDGYDVRMVRMQDYHLLLRLGQLGPVWSMGERHLIGYRVHPGQTSSKAVRFWSTMHAIGQERNRLARVLGRSLVLQGAHNTIYGTAQAARYAGLRRPGFLRGLTGSEA